MLFFFFIVDSQLKRCCVCFSIGFQTWVGQAIDERSGKWTDNGQISSKTPMWNVTPAAVRNLH